MAAITGTSTMRDTMASRIGGCPIRPNTKIETTTTHNKNAVPQRVWVKEKRCTSLGTSGARCSNALIVLCSAPVVLKNAAHLIDPAHEGQVTDEEAEPYDSFCRVCRQRIRQGMLTRPREKERQHKEKTHREGQ